LDPRPGRVYFAEWKKRQGGLGPTCYLRAFIFFNVEVWNWPVQRQRNCRECEIKCKKGVKSLTAVEVWFNLLILIFFLMANEKWIPILLELELKF
jgi:hypothetical protein